MAPPLTQRTCKPVKPGTPALAPEETRDYQKELKSQWRVEGNVRLNQEFRFKDFREALAFVNTVGEIAERENHHTDIVLSYGKVTVEFSTHSIGGLSENDFIVAAKIEEAL